MNAAATISGSHASPTDGVASFTITRDIGTASLANSSPPRRAHIFILAEEKKKGAMSLRTKIAFAFFVLVMPAHCFGQGTLTITFDQPPQLNGQWSVASYGESGMLFTSANTFYRYSGDGTTFGMPVFSPGTYIQTPGGSGNPVICDFCKNANGSGHFHRGFRHFG
jgi:hypothetical protein